MKKIGWEELDILLIQGDAYIDHPAQGPALLGRWLMAHGFRVGLISQPGWSGPDDFMALGRPRLFAAISAGSMDSMLAHYTAFRKKRSDDALTPGGQAGARPNRATLVYTGLVRAAFPGLPVVIGGLEASLRRLSHYDFWQEKLRRSFLLESKANLLVYGPGERPLLEIARRLAENASASLAGIWGTAVSGRPADAQQYELVEVPGHEAIEENSALLMTATLEAEAAVHNGNRVLYQPSGTRGVTVFPPAEALTTGEMDFLYGLPFTRRAHPSYKESVPALAMLKTSLTTHRGCGGGCSFCSLSLHQGRRISSRSLTSLLNEATKMASRKPVALSDVGAPTANMWGAVCNNDAACRRKSCLWPTVCQHFKADQAAWLKMLEELAALDCVSQVRVASGVRYDLALTDSKSLGIFLKKFVGGQLKVAPEHIDDRVLRLMRKPGVRMWEKFLNFFDGNKDDKWFLVPYFISSFPGSDLKGMRHLAEWLKARHWRPRQVQAFIPTPGTVATAMYYSGKDEEGLPLTVARRDSDRLVQHSLLAPPPASLAPVKKAGGFGRGKERP